MPESENHAAARKELKPMPPEPDKSEGLQAATPKAGEINQPVAKADTGVDSKISDPKEERKPPRWIPSVLMAIYFSCVDQNLRPIHNWFTAEVLDLRRGWQVFIVLLVLACWLIQHFEAKHYTGILDSTNTFHAGQIATLKNESEKRADTVLQLQLEAQKQRQSYSDLNNNYNHLQLEKGAEIEKMKRDADAALSSVRTNLLSIKEQYDQAANGIAHNAEPDERFNMLKTWSEKLFARSNYTESAHLFEQAVEEEKKHNPDLHVTRSSQILYLTACLMTNTTPAGESDFALKVDGIITYYSKDKGMLGYFQGDLDRITNVVPTNVLPVVSMAVSNIIKYRFSP